MKAEQSSSIIVSINQNIELLICLLKTQSWWHFSCFNLFLSHITQMNDKNATGNISTISISTTLSHFSKSLPKLDLQAYIFIVSFYSKHPSKNSMKNNI